MKKIIAILLTLVMVFGLVACGNKTEETKETEPAKDTEEAVDDAEAEDQGEEKASSGDWTIAVVPKDEENPGL